MPARSAAERSPRATVKTWSSINTTLPPRSTISSAVANNGATAIGLTKSGPGTLVLSSSASSYTGPTSINGGIVQAGAANVIPSTSALVLSGAGTTFDLEGFSQSVGSLANFNPSVSTMAGVNFGYGTAVVADGTATLTVGNDNTNTTYNGALGTARENSR